MKMKEQLNVRDIGDDLFGLGLSDDDIVEAEMLLKTNPQLMQAFQTVTMAMSQTLNKSRSNRVAFPSPLLMKLLARFRRFHIDEPLARK